jgi:hypothetical protein
MQPSLVDRSFYTLRIRVGSYAGGGDGNGGGYYINIYIGEAKDPLVRILKNGE